MIVKYKILNIEYLNYKNYIYKYWVDYSVQLLCQRLL